MRERLPQGAVRPVTVVVAFELVQHDSGVSLVDDQEAVEEFAADCPDESLRDRIRPRCPHRRVGARTPQTSRDLLILVDEPAEAVVSFDLVDLGCGVTGEWSCGSGLPQSAVRPVIVVVAFEFV